MLAPHAARADIPPAGSHGTEKIWPNAGFIATNFSPTNTPVVGLSPDGSGGLWFGAGVNLNHIDRDGRMESYAISREWLWAVKGYAIDPYGRRWFSLGQSGRIATLGRYGHVHTQVLVPRRYFPDIRELAFDGHGALWFLDFGRSSIGRRAASGAVRETPLPAGEWAGHMIRCAGATWITIGGNSGSSIDVIRGDTETLRTALTWGESRSLSIACDAHGTLWYTAVGSERTAIGTIDRRGRNRQYPSTLDIADVHSGMGGSIYLTGRKRGKTYVPWWLSRLVILKASRPQGSEINLPLPYGSQTELTAALDGTLWLAVRDPWSIVRLAPVRTSTLTTAGERSTIARRRFRFCARG